MNTAAIPSFAMPATADDDAAGDDYLSALYGDWEVYQETAEVEALRRAPRNTRRVAADRAPT